MRHPTVEQLDDLADEFYGFANELAYTAGPRKYAPKNEWTQQARSLWSDYIAIATLISDLSDRIGSLDEPGVVPDEGQNDDRADKAEAILHTLGWVKSTDHVTGAIQWFSPVEQ